MSKEDQRLLSQVALLVELHRLAARKKETKMRGDVPKSLLRRQEVVRRKLAAFSRDDGKVIDTAKEWQERMTGEGVGESCEIASPNARAKELGYGKESQPEGND